MRLLIEYDLRPFVAAISAIEEGAAKVDRFLEDVGHAAQAEFKRILDTNGLGRWAPLAEGTEKIRARKGLRGKPMLQRRGVFRESLLVRGAPGNIWQYKDGTLEVGTDIPYAYHHQQGIKSGMPARPFIIFTEELRVEIQRLAVAYLAGIRT